MEQTRQCQRVVPRPGFIPGSPGSVGGRSEAGSEVVFWANAAALSVAVQTKPVDCLLRGR